MALNDLIKGFKTFPTGLAIFFFRFLKIFSNNDRGKVAIISQIRFNQLLFGLSNEIVGIYAIWSSRTKIEITFDSEIGQRRTLPFRK